MKKIFILSSLIVTTLATPSFATPTELDKKTVASKAYVDTKQDIIETSMVETRGYTLPSLVTYDSTDGGLTGTKFGVLRQSDLDSEGSPLKFCAGADDCEEMLPTVRAVADALQDLLEYIDWTPLDWDNNTLPAAINAYSITFDPTVTHVNGNWPYDEQGHLVRADTFAKSLALKQNKIPAGTAGNVVTYTGTAGTVGSVAVSSTEDYNQQNELTNGSNLANVQLVSTKQNKMTCAGWDSETHTDEHCWLWSIE